MQTRMTANKGPEGRERVAHGLSRGFEELPANHQNTRVSFRAERGISLCFSSAMSDFDGQGQIPRSARDDRFLHRSDLFTPSHVVGYYLAPLRGYGRPHASG